MRPKCLEDSMQIRRRLPARLAIAGILLSSLSCTSQKATYAPDGRRGFVITCSGFLNSWSTCLIDAGRACGSRGYDTIQGGEEDRNMLIACK
jgi:hypothetical protein